MDLVVEPPLWRCERPQPAVLLVSTAITAPSRGSTASASRGKGPSVQGSDNSVLTP